jgi:1-phosphofructokinase family hexose kinase
VTLSPIVCVSPNPAIDRRLRFASFAAGRINRAHRVDPLPGGKAAHVAMAARALGAETAWLGFLGGSTGQEFVAKFGQLGVQVVRVGTKKPTRMNLELLENSGRITEVLEPGGAPTSAELAEMVEVLRRGLRRRWRGAVVVISGSLPAGVSPGFYKALIVAATAAGSRVFVDTSGDALRASLAAHPSFLKPNREEGEALLGRRLRGEAGTLEAAEELIRRGAQSAAVSLGAEGLVWLEGRDGPAWFARPPRMRAVSTVGCGDATVAGFGLADVKGMASEAAIRLAAACGAANCLAEFPGRISAKQVQSLLPRIRVHRID